jgi:hypothetical protein
VNRLTLAVAGGRKTQAIVDRCREAPAHRRILVVTFTMANQDEITARLAMGPSLEATVHVQGWFSFLLGHWIRPYLPLQFPGRRLTGLNFEGDPGRFATGAARFLDEGGRAYKLHLAQLALLTATASKGAVLDRLGRIYDEVFVDEVQDLNGYDLELLRVLFDSAIDLELVGDVRQALLLTNPREKKNAQFKGIGVKKWFDAMAAKGLVEVHHASTTWRCNQAIADFADSIFDDTWGFTKTTSMNDDETGHDGVFVVHPDHVRDYVAMFSPLCLRHNASSARSLALPFTNFTLAKGRTAERVLIAPTGPIRQFLQSGAQLEDLAACSLYVAVTRARFSVAFVTDAPQKVDLPRWTP